MHAANQAKLAFLILFILAFAGCSGGGMDPVAPVEAIREFV